MLAQVPIAAKIAGLVAGSLAVYVASALAIYRALVLIRIAPYDVRTETLPLIVPLFLCMPVFLALGFGHFAARRWGLDGATVGRTPLKVLARTAIVGYALTCFVGVPQVLSEQRTWLVQGYLRSQQVDGQLKRDWPVVNRSWGAVPILPFVILNYHEYENVAAGTGSFRGVELSVWYVTGVRPVAAIPLRGRVWFP